MHSLEDPTATEVNLGYGTLSLAGAPGGEQRNAALLQQARRFVEARFNPVLATVPGLQSFVLVEDCYSTKTSDIVDIIFQLVDKCRFPGATSQPLLVFGKQSKNFVQRMVVGSVVEQSILKGDLCPIVVVPFGACADL